MKKILVIEDEPEMPSGMDLGADDYLTAPDIATILGITESTVRKHVHEIFEKLGVEIREAARVRALEALSSRPMIL